MSPTCFVEPGCRRPFGWGLIEHNLRITSSAVTVVVSRIWSAKYHEVNISQLSQPSRRWNMFRAARAARTARNPLPMTRSNPWVHNRDRLAGTVAAWWAFQCCVSIVGTELYSLELKETNREFLFFGYIQWCCGRLRLLSPASRIVHHLSIWQGLPRQCWLLLDHRWLAHPLDFILSHQRLVNVTVKYC